MLSYHHFTLDERKSLYQYLNEGYSIRKIAGFLGRSPSSVSREIKRNKAKHKTSHNCGNPYCYNPHKANNDAIHRSRQNKYRRLQPDTPEWDYVIQGLLSFWSPDEISMRWKKDHADMKAFSTSTLYRDLKRKRLPRVSRENNLRRRGKRRYNKKTSPCNVIHPDRIIPDWPDEIKKRLRFGDLEGDTIYGGIGKGLIITMVDRKTRYLFAALVDSRDSKLVAGTMSSMLSGVPVKSISLDNGSEFSEFHKVEAALKAPVYFAEPHKPWQRGTNENTNDILRFFFPKGYDFHSLSSDRLAEVVALINNRPRKCLGYLSPCEYLKKLGVALA